MTKTTNYQLPKWEKTDRVQMKDFNDMTATLDEALHGLAVSAEAAQAAVDSEAAARAAADTALENKSRFTKLKVLRITSYATSAELDLSDVDWAQWDKVHLDMMTTNGQQGSIYINSEGEGNYLASMYSGYSKAGIYHPRMTFHPNGQASRFVTVSYNGTFKSVKLTYDALEKLIFSANMNSGIYLVLWGEK